MPVIKSAKKKLKKDKERTKRNSVLLTSVKKSVKNAKKVHSEKAVREAVSYVDKAVKKNLIHKNKASRTKSQLSKLIKKTSVKSSSTKKEPVKK